MPLTQRFGKATLAACLCVLALGCDSKKTEGPPSASAAPPKTPDRLGPGELAEGKTSLFGLKLPLGMELEARFETSAHASGLVSAEQLSNYVRHRVDACHCRDAPRLGLC